MYSPPDRRTVTGALISGAVIAGLTWVFVRGDHPAERQIPATDQESADSQEHASQASARQPGITPAERAQITSAAPPDQPRNRSESGRSAERLDELPFPKNRAFTVRHTMFLSEQRDPVWSPNTEAAILDLIVLSSPDTGLASIEVECRTTICRAQLSLIGEEVSDFFADFSVMATMHGHRLRTSIEDDLGLDVVLFDSGIVYGTPTSLLYLRRDSRSKN